LKPEKRDCRSVVLIVTVSGLDSFPMIFQFLKEEPGIRQNILMTRIINFLKCLLVEMK
jgi:hypothetical protein